MPMTDRSDITPAHVYEIVARVEKKVDKINLTVVNHDRWIWFMKGALGTLGLLVTILIAIVVGYLG